MPEFTYTGLIPWNYPETRDATGVLLGDVAVGDVRDLGEAPDDKWAPAFLADDPDRPSKSAPKEDWRDYAASAGAVAEGDAEKLTKAQLQGLTAPVKGGKATDTKAGPAGKEA